MRIRNLKKNIINMKYPFFILKIFFVYFFLLTSCSTPNQNETGPTPYLMTLNGKIPVDSLSLALIHEHVFLDWSPAEDQQPEHWNNEEAFDIILPQLQAVQALGVNTFLECTPQYIGRNLTLLKRLADSTGLNILTNTGYYGAREDEHVPEHAYRETADQLAARWIQEWEEGIEGTGIRPGFIKIGVDGDSVLSDIDEKLVRAAARTHLQTGLTIVAHTGPDAPALQQVDILEEEGVSPDAWVWTHAQNGTSPTQIALAQKGAWISLDGMGWIDPVEGDSTALFKYIDQLVQLKTHALLHRTLISHDAGWYTHGEEKGGEFKPFTPIFDLVIPELRKRGFEQADLDQLFINNPREAYQVRVRKEEGAD
jgi:phosphotriesterase-related protein